MRKITGEVLPELSDQHSGQTAINIVELVRDPVAVRPVGRVDQGFSMRSWVRGVAVLVAGLALSACDSSGRYSRGDGPPITVEEANAAAPFLPPLPPVVMTGETKGEPDPEKVAHFDLKEVEWPLRIKRRFVFGGRCVNTTECLISYDGLRYASARRNISEDPYSSKAIRDWSAGQFSAAFDYPVHVTWRSLDGVARSAVLDLDKIFSDRIIRHVVPRQEVPMLPKGAYNLAPSVLVEVNDRIIHVYTRAFIPTRHVQRLAGRPIYYRHDLILVKTLTY